MGAYDNLELGFVGGTTPEEGVFVNAKYFIMADSEAYPTSLAVGFQNMGSKRDSSLYIVASKVFEEGLEGHFGFRAIFDDKIDSSAMLGIEYFFSDLVSVCLDYTGEDSLYTLNLSSRVYLKEYLTFRFAVLDINKKREDGETAFAVGLSFGRYF